jgi:hypothetical protein
MTIIRIFILTIAALLQLSQQKASKLSNQSPNIPETQCKPDHVESPINLKFPMSYVPFQIDFKLLGEFGAVFYQNIEYRIYDVHFKYPSEHRVILFVILDQRDSVCDGNADFDC